MGERARALGALAAGLLAGAAPALAYCSVAFGSPLATPYRYHVGFEATRKLGTMYGGAFLDGFTGLLFRPQAGLLLFSPVLALGFWALPRAWRALGTRRAAATLLPGLSLLLLTSKHATWDGGAAHDARYLMLVMPMFCLPVGFFYSSARAVGTLLRAAERWRSSGACFYLSALVQAGKHAAGWMRSATPFVLQILDAASHSSTVPLRDFLAWLFPHPLAATCVLGVGLAGAALIWPRPGERVAVLARALPRRRNRRGGRSWRRRYTDMNHTTNDEGAAGACPRVQGHRQAVAGGGAPLHDRRARRLLDTWQPFIENFGRTHYLAP